MNSKSELIGAVQEAEDALLGAILIESTGASRQVIEEVSRIVKPYEFRNSRNRKIYEAMLSCNEPPHQIAVAHELARLEKLEKGDCSHLHYVVSTVPFSLDYLHYAKMVKDYGNLRTGNKLQTVRGAY